MGAPDGSDAPVVEPPPSGEAPDLTLRALQQRIRQQEILAELGVIAIQGASFDQLLSDTARLTAEGLRAEFCKVLEYIPKENSFLVRAGVGWNRELSVLHASAPILLLRRDLLCVQANQSFPITWKTKSASERPKFSNNTPSIVP